MKIWPRGSWSSLRLLIKVKTCTRSYCLLIEFKQRKSEKLLKYVSILRWWLQILSVTNFKCYKFLVYHNFMIDWNWTKNASWFQGIISLADEYKLDMIFWSKCNTDRYTIIISSKCIIVLTVWSGMKVLWLTMPHSIWIKLL